MKYFCKIDGHYSIVQNPDSSEAGTTDKIQHHQPILRPTMVEQYGWPDRPHLAQTYRTLVMVRSACAAKKNCMRPVCLAKFRKPHIVVIATCPLAEGTVSESEYYVSACIYFRVS